MGEVVAGPGSTSAWAVASGSGYKRDGFYTKSTDDRGHSAVSTRIRLRPEVLQEISALVAQRRVPAYRTQADFIRDAIVHRLHAISEMAAGGSVAEREHLEDLLDRLAMDEDIIAYRQELNDATASLKALSDVAEYALRSKDFETLELFINRMRSRAVRQREPFRAQMLAELIEIERQLARAKK